MEEATTRKKRKAGAVDETKPDGKSDDASDDEQPDAGDQPSGSTPVTDILGTNQLPPFRPREIIATNLSAAKLNQVRRMGFKETSRKSLPRLNLSVSRLQAPANMDLARAQQLLAQQLSPENFGPNYVYGMVYTAQAAPRTESRKESNDGDSRASTGKECRGERCFGPTLINWKRSLRSCATDAKIGIIDTSFDVSHPAFRGLKWRLGHFLDTDKASRHDWHGTAVLSLLAGDPASSTPGLIPDAEFYLAMAFASDEQGNASTSTANLLEALNWLDEQGVQFINMSFSGPRDPLFERAIKAMAKRGVVFVAAAGNQGPSAAPAYPAAYQPVIAVTAIDRRMEVYRYANRGDYVDLAAPGVEVWTALPGAKEGFRTGTSFAAPFVTAIAASQAHTRSAGQPNVPFLRQMKVKDLGDRGRDATFGRGLALAPDACPVGSGVVAQGTYGPAPPPLAVTAADKPTW